MRLPLVLQKKHFRYGGYLSIFITTARLLILEIFFLQDAFPENKTQEAIVFCQEEILSYICENLTVHTVQTLNNAKTTLPEDAEAKYQRVLISSLQGYTLYLNAVSLEHIEKQVDSNLKIISHAKFWKLAKHKVATIRSAWFGVITALCQKSPLLREKEAGHIIGSVFGNLDEKEPVVLPAVWESLLSVLSTVNVNFVFLMLECKDIYYFYF